MNCNKLIENDKDEIKDEIKDKINNNDDEEIDDLIEIMKKSCYVKNCKTNKEKDKNSLSYLIDFRLSQSDCIKLGTALEKVFSEIIMDKNRNLVNIKPKNKKGFKEKDHLFKDDENKIIYYAELKSNLNLDTEKSKSTIEKCKTIIEDLKKKYNDYEIKWCLIGLRYINFNEIPKVINKKYEEIKNNLFGINDYFNLLKIDKNFNNKNYKKFLNETAKICFALHQ